MICFNLEGDISFITIYTLINSEYAYTNENEKRKKKKKETKVILFRIKFDLYFSRRFESYRHHFLNHCLKKKKTFEGVECFGTFSLLLLHRPIM